MSKIEKIDKGYAIIYIDHDGEGLDEQGNFSLPESIVTDYYSVSGAIQWNFYYIIPGERFDKFGTPEEVLAMKKTHMLDATFARKYPLLEKNIPKFIENMFPPKLEEHGKIAIFKGVNYLDAKNNALKILKSDTYKNYKPITSVLRNYSTLKTLYVMDCLRRDLLRKPHMNVLYYTHLDKELNLLKPKFDFINPPILKKEHVF